jgi:hypothetical protein
VVLAPSAVACSGDGRCHRIDAADSDIFKCNDHEAAPDSRAFEVEERERGSLCELSFAATDGFLKKAANNPRIGGNWLARQGRIGIDFAGEPLLGCAKCVAHEFPKI